MNRWGCLSDEEIAILAAGALDEAARTSVRSHLDECGRCRARWAEASEEVSAFAPPAVETEALAAAAVQAFSTVTRRPSGAVRRARWALAAAAVLLTAVAIRFFWPEPAARSAFTLPAGREVSGRDLVVETFDTAEAFRLPDGSRFRVAPASRVTFQAPGPGERIRLTLARGTLDAEVVRGSGAVRLAAEGGEIFVVGTRFRARAFRMHAPAAARSFPILSVEVHEGAVDLVGAAGAARVSAGRRGILKEGEPPVLQEAAPIDWRAAASRWGSAWAEPGFAASWEGATLLAGTWGGLSDWEEALFDRAASPALRRVAAALVAVRTEASDVPRLARWIKTEPDEEIRTLLLPHLARAAGPEIETLLRERAASDPSARVRGAAERLLEVLDEGRR